MTTEPKGTPGGGDRLDRLADHRDDLDRVSQRFEQAEAVMAEATATDDSGAVSARVSPQGELLDVIVSTRWKSDLTAVDLGPAVVQAYTGAILAGSQAWATAVGDQFAGTEPSTRPMPTAQESTYAALDGVASDEELAAKGPEVLETLTELLRRANDEVDTVIAQARQAAETHHVGESRGATATVSGNGELVAVELDSRWVDSTHPSSVAQHTLKAYQLARRQARARTVDSVLDSSVFGEVQRLRNDPRALAAHLGLM